MSYEHEHSRKIYDHYEKKLEELEREKEEKERRGKLKESVNFLNKLQRVFKNVKKLE